MGSVKQAQICRIEFYEQCNEIMESRLGIAIVYGPIRRNVQMSS